MGQVPAVGKEVPHPIDADHRDLPCTVPDLDTDLEVDTIDPVAIIRFVRCREHGARDDESRPLVIIVIRTKRLGIGMTRNACSPRIHRGGIFEQTFRPKLVARTCRRNIERVGRGFEFVVAATRRRTCKHPCRPIRDHALVDAWRRGGRHRSLCITHAIDSDLGDDPARLGQRRCSQIADREHSIRSATCQSGAVAGSTRLGKKVFDLTRKAFSGWCGFHIAAGTLFTDRSRRTGWRVAYFIRSTAAACGSELTKTFAREATGVERRQGRQGPKRVQGF